MFNDVLDFLFRRRNNYRHGQYHQEEVFNPILIQHDIGNHFINQHDQMQFGNNDAYYFNEVVFDDVPMNPNQGR
jgi:hypothetical protein